MFGIILFILAVGGLAALGWWRGGSRLGLALAPLLLCSVFLWLAGGIAYQIDMMRNLGLVWPALFLIIPGLIGGYLLRYWLRKKLPKDPPRTDRIIGAGVGVLLGVMITWLGLVYQTVIVASRQGTPSSFSMGMARTLNNGVVRWIPGVGAGSTAVMDLVDIATAPDQVREQVVQDLNLDSLRDVPEMQAIIEDPDIRAEIESIQRGNILALWRLQKDQRILALFNNREVRDVLDRVSLDDIADAINRAESQQEDEPADRNERGSRDRDRDRDDR